MEIDEPLFTIGTVAKMTGVKIPTIRMWEDSNGLLRPARSKGRFRLYSMRDVETIRILKEKILVDKMPARVVSRTDMSVAKAAHDPTAAKLRSLYRASAAFNSTRELPQVLQQILTLASDSFDIESTVILLEDETTNEHDRSLKKASRGVLGSNLLTEFDETLFREVMASKGIIALADLDLSIALSTTSGRTSFKSILALPLLCEDSFEGLLYLASASPRVFSNEEMVYAGAFANMAAAALTDARTSLRLKASNQRYRSLVENSIDLQFSLNEIRQVEQTLLQRNKELSALKTIATSLSRSLDLNEVMQLALEKVMEITGMEIGLLGLVDEDAGEIVLKVHRGAPPDLVEEARRMKLGTGIAGRVAITGDPIHVDNIADDPRLIILVSRRMKHQSLICVPLKSKSEVLGTVTLVSGSFRPITTEDMQLISSIGHLIGGAIENAKLHEQSVRSHNERLMMMQDKLAQVTEAQRDERKRLARELHDDVIQSIAALVVELEGKIARGINRGTEEMDREKSILQDVLEATKRLLFDLRGPFLEGRGLASILEEALPRQTQNTGSEIKLQVSSWPEVVPRDVTFHLYRIVQESLANVRKHAKAKHVEIGLFSDEHHVEVQIRDDGIGFDADKLSRAQGQGGSFGLAGMRERVNLLGGKLAIDTALGTGTSITVTVPRYWDLDLGDARVRVLIVDDHALFSQALANLIGSQEQIEVVGIARSGQEALELAQKLLPDIIMMDIHLPDMSGIEVTRAIRAENPSARVMLLTAFDKEYNVLEGLRAGAIGFVSKTCSPTELVQCVKSALRGEHIINPRIAGQVLDLFRQWPEGEDRILPFDGLTHREVEILRMLAAGKASKEISRSLSITDKTVRRHISNIYQKLQVYDRAQLAIYAVKKGLIDVDRDL